MKIMDFMSFDLSWFKSLPGILLILGCFCLIIAIILIPTLTKKKDEFELDLDPKEGEELLNKEEVTTNIIEQPVNTPIVEEVKSQVENTMPVVENVQMPVENEKIAIEPVSNNNVPISNEAINNNPVLNVEPTIISSPEIKAESDIVIEEPKVEEIPTPVVNNISENSSDMTIPEVIPTIINTPEIKEEVKNDSFGGEKLLPDDFKVEINEKKEAFGGEKLLPDDFKPEIEKPHLSNTQSFSLRDIAIQKQQEEVKVQNENVLPVVENQSVEEKTKDDIELLEL